MKVRDIMSAPVVTVGTDTNLEEVARLMLDRQIGAVPVVGPDGRLVGIVTESDFSAKERPVPFSFLRLPSVLGHWLPDAVEEVYEAARAVKAAEIMTRNAVTVSEDDLLKEAIRRMCEHDVHRLPVVRGRVPVGMITRHDLLRLMLHREVPCTVP